METLPSELLGLISDYANWLPLREVSKRLQSVIKVSKEVRSRYLRASIRDLPISLTEWLLNRYRIGLDRVLTPRYYVPHQFIFNASVFSYLGSRDDDVEYLKGLLEQYQLVSADELETLTALSALAGHFEVLKYIFDTLSYYPEYYHVKDGRTDILEWLQSAVSSHTGDAMTMCRCVLVGHWKNLACLRDHGFGWNEWVTATCATKVEFEQLEWVVSNGCPLGARTLQDVIIDYVESDQDSEFILETLMWLHKLGAPMHPLLCATAAHYGRWDVLMWLRSHGCSWDERTPQWAADSGHYDIVKWVHSEGCPWDWRTATHTIAPNKKFTSREQTLAAIRMLEWLISEDCEYTGRSSDECLPRIRAIGDPNDSDERE